MKVAWGFLGVLLFSSVGCASAHSAMESQFQTMEAEMDKLQARQDKLSERVDTLETGSLVGTAPSSGPPSQDTSSLPVVVLQPGDPGMQDETTDDPKNPPVSVIREYGDGKNERRSKATSSSDANHDYSAALSLVRKKHFAEAITAWNAFLVTYPNDVHAENALFWLGDSYAEQGDPGQATTQLEAVLSRFPQGNKAPDALWKLAMLARQSGDTAHAKQLLDQLRSQFPTSDAAHRASKE